VTLAFVNKSVFSLIIKVPMLLAVLVLTDNQFQIVGAALIKEWDSK